MGNWAVALICATWVTSYFELPSPDGFYNDRNLFFPHFSASDNMRQLQKDNSCK